MAKFKKSKVLSIKTNLHWVPIEMRWLKRDNIFPPNAETSLFICSMFRLCGLCPHFSVSRISDIFLWKHSRNVSAPLPPCPSSEVGQLNWICHKTPEDLFPLFQSDLPLNPGGFVSANSLQFAGGARQGLHFWLRWDKHPWRLPGDQTLKWRKE